MPAEQKSAVQLIEECKDNKLELSKQLKQLDKNSLLSVEKATGVTALHVAARYGLDFIVEEILEETKGEGLAVLDRKGQSPLHILFGNGRLELLKKIQKKIAKSALDLRNNKGRTPLHSAAKWLQFGVIKWIDEEYKHEFDVVDAQGSTPLGLAYRRHFSGSELVGQFTEDQAITYLKNIKAYWFNSPLLKQLKEKITALRAAPLDEQQEQIAYEFIYCAGLDNYLLPGIKIELDIGRFNYVVNGIHFNRFLKIIILQNLADRNLLILCIDQGHFTQRLELMAQPADQVLLGQVLTTITSNSHCAVYSNGAADVFAKALATKLGSRSQAYHFSSLDVDAAMPERHKPVDEKATGFDMALEAALAELSAEKNRGINRKATVITAHFNPTKADAKAEPIKEDKPLQPCDAVQKMNAVVKAYQQSLVMIAADLKKVPAETDHYRRLFSFAVCEYVGHYLAYAHLPDKTSVPVFQDNGTVQQYILHQVVHHQGLYCYALLTTLRDGAVKVLLAFQGTDPTDISSVARDLDKRSAGYRRIRAQYLTIVNNLNALLKDSKKLELIICGHSLGGADAQNFFIALLALKAESYYHQRKTAYSGDVIHLRRFFAKTKPPAVNALVTKVTAMHLYAYNAAGIRHTTALLAKEAASYLIQHDEKFEMSVNHQRVFQDVVNLVGQATLHDFADSKLEVNLLFFQGKENFGARVASAHTDYQFIDNQATVEKPLDFKPIVKLNGYQLYRSLTHKEQLSVELCSKSKVEPDTPLYHAVKQFLQSGKISKHLLQQIPAMKTTVNDEKRSLLARDTNKTDAKVSESANVDALCQQSPLFTLVPIPNKPPSAAVVLPSTVIPTAKK
jgi:hypothetical protein